MKKLTEKFNSISVKVGETFLVEIASNPSTGYHWTIKEKNDKAELLQHSFHTAHDDDEAVFVGGQEVFLFRATASGDLELNGEYKRPFGASPAKITCRFHVRAD